MDSTRPLKVCCAFWHQDVKSRSFKSCKLLGESSMDSLCLFLQNILHTVCYICRLRSGEFGVLKVITLSSLPCSSRHFLQLCIILLNVATVRRKHSCHDGGEVGFLTPFYLHSSCFLVAFYRAHTVMLFCTVPYLMELFNGVVSKKREKIPNTGTDTCGWWGILLHSYHALFILPLVVCSIWFFSEFLPYIIFLALSHWSLWGHLTSEGIFFVAPFCSSAWPRIRFAWYLCSVWKLVTIIASINLKSYNISVCKCTWCNTV